MSADADGYNFLLIEVSTETADKEVMSSRSVIPETNVPRSAPAHPAAGCSHAAEAILGSPSVFDKNRNPTGELDSNVLEASRLILESAGEGIYGLDLRGYATFVNPAAHRITGWSLEDMRSHSQHSIVHHSHADGSHYPREECPIYQALRDGVVHHREDEVFWRKDGTCFPVSYTSTPLMRKGVQVGAVVVFRDITEQVREREWEGHKAQIFSRIIEQRPLRDTLSYLADAFTRAGGSPALAIHLREDRSMFLVTASGLSGMEQEAIASLKFVKPRDRAPFGWTLPLPDHSEQGILSGSNATLPLLTGSGEILGQITAFWFSTPGGACHKGPELAGAADFARLAIEHSALQQQLLQAQHDSLTGLPNRILLEGQIVQAMENAKRHGLYVGVCYIDLDRFKEVNDMMGHGVGDQYLVQVSSRIKTNCRKIDTLARQGGDEFILLLPDLSSPEEAHFIIKRLLETLREPFYVENSEFSTTASIGISVYPENGETAGLLLQNADMALYAAKRAGRDQAQMFNSALGDKIREHGWIHANIQFALAKNQFRLMYQPIFRPNRELEGFEALLRWHHPDGMISPDRFIPIAEETGLIVPIGAWVLHEGCRQAKTWQRAGQSPMRLAVNVSGVQVSREDFVDTVAAALRESDLDPHLLELEITETWIIADPTSAAAQLRKLRELGIGISVDDFGTGHSSLGCLQNMPLDTLKIDRSFVARLDGTSMQLSIVRAIVTLAQQLGLRTIAEGVETEEQLTDLASIGCDFIQGFLFAKPLSVERATNFVAERAGAALEENSLIRATSPERGRGRGVDLTSRIAVITVQEAA